MSSQSPAGPPPETPSAPTQEIGRGLAPTRETTTPGTPSPRPEMMLGLWTSWVESVSKLASDMRAAPGGLSGQAAWQMSPDQLTGGLQQLGEMVARDSILNSILRATDDALNANPLRPHRRLATGSVDSGARCNGSMKTEFGRLCQAL